MNRYKVVQNGVVTNEWTSDVYGADHYESGFGLPERWKNEAECTPEEIASAIQFEDLNDELNPDQTYRRYLLPKTYELIVEDISSEIDNENQTKTNIIALKLRLRNLAGQSDLTTAEVKEAILKMIKLRALQKEI